MTSYSNNINCQRTQGLLNEKREHMSCREFKCTNFAISITSIHIIVTHTHTHIQINKAINTKPILYNFFSFYRSPPPICPSGATLLFAYWSETVSCKQLYSEYYTYNRLWNVHAYHIVYYHYYIRRVTCIWPFNKKNHTFTRFAFLLVCLSAQCNTIIVLQYHTLL